MAVMNPYQNSQDALTAQQNQFNQYMQQLPQMQQAQTAQIQDQGMGAAQQGKQQVDQNANARGLLYSGMKQGGEAQVANQAAKQTANAVATNNQNLIGQSQNFGQGVQQNTVGDYQGQVQQTMAQNNANLQQNAQNNQQLGLLMQGVGMAAGMYMSDKKVKDGVKDSEKDVSEMFDKLSSKKYSYKEDPDKKEHLGILAQDLEKSPMGKAIVIETPKGKAVDAMKALSALMAAQSTIHKRLKKIGA